MKYKYDKVIEFTQLEITFHIGLYCSPIVLLKDVKYVSQNTKPTLSFTLILYMYNRLDSYVTLVCKFCKRSSYYLISVIVK